MSFNLLILNSMFISRIFCYVFLIGVINISVTNHAVAQTNDTAYGRVVSIIDGDTFIVLLNNNQQEKIRLHGIDCPEKNQDFGQAAKKKLSELIFSQKVLVKRTDKDRYGRTIAVVYDDKNNCVNEEMIRTGYAWHYLKYDNNKAWAQLETEARLAKRGLWFQPNAIPPWKWRNK
jgi:micrococcal nuclease